MGKPDTHVLRYGRTSHLIFYEWLIPDGDGIQGHPFSFYSSVLCQLQLFSLENDANIIKKEETIMKTGSLIY